jgi:CRISPR-associated endonuclease/helicase Cas3
MKPNRHPDRIGQDRGSRPGVSTSDFASQFRLLTGADEPFPWQEQLFALFEKGEVPSCCDIPTGLGKTSVIAIWLIALCKFPTKTPRRLVYIVNRRTVVDQTTAEVEKLRRNLDAAGLTKQLEELCALSADSPLAISTLRGQFADNREWSADPCRPAVIVGTVDMMGSRLLFGGYGIGFKTRPLHAGFLAQDTLIVHDEAHLEPAFQDLITALKAEQQHCADALKIHVMELSATPRSEGEPFRITKADEEHPVVNARLGAVKKLALHPVDDVAKVQSKIVELAQRHKTSRRAVLVFATGVKDVEQIAKALESEIGKKNVERLTGTMRGLERDRLLKRAAFVRFLQKDDVAPDAEAPAEGTVYLVCTSAGEVGINISADHLVCDLSTFDSMAQRFGRVNRFGAANGVEVDVVHPLTFDERSERERRKALTLALLQKLSGSASPNAIREIPANERRAAFAPEPIILPVSDILFDAWSLTTITGKFPGRPALAPYLHGIDENEPNETRVAWRDEVDYLATRELRGHYPPDELLADYPLKPHELLRNTSARVWDALAKIVSRDKAKADLPAWLLDESGTITVTKVGKLADKQAKEDIFNVTLLLPPTAGGLSGGMLDGTSDTANDVADEWYDEHQQPRRLRLWSDDEELEDKSSRMRLIREIDLHPEAGETDDEEGAHARWRWFELPRSADSEGSRSARRPVLLAAHTRDVQNLARQFAEKSGLTAEMVEAVALAGRFHDSGKNRRVWQLSIGNSDTNLVLAKSGRKSMPHQLGSYRHEFGSGLDLESAHEFQQLSADMKDLVLHLVAAHHGRARPHFPADEIFDQQHPQERAAAFAVEAPRRFARLQRKYGRWHLAWLESLLRAADYAASAKPSEEEP